ncbi:MAG: Panacea domain-containing protein [bacterium]|nr:Panacea domain-containing protein [bacterium]
MNYNREKFKQAVLFFATNGGWDVGKKKLAKLLYFTDFTLYELREQSLTEMEYTKKDYGPMPEPKVFYKALCDLEKEGAITVEKPNSIKLEKIVPKEKVNLQVFDDDEKQVLTQILEKYRAENAGGLERLAQAEPPYKMVAYEERIPYYLAFYRNSFGEMDLSHGENSNTR